ncbi:hypothetical protein C3731_12895 [Brucella oryzae]|uniref:Lipoprotein n=1 Tax=Brucella oryzae TaxID=335286 RepID=A0A2S7IYX4_9HYPH|nr:hypothetical protein C3731_12895 [Brucella oryzae]
MKRFLYLLPSVALVSGCATRSDNISASYVPSSVYNSQSCSQLKEEAVRLSYSAATAVGRQNSAATRDTITTGVGLVLFWPALFLNNGDGAKAAEVARLKGEMQALERASALKGCNITFRNR